MNKNTTLLLLGLLFILIFLAIIVYNITGGNKNILPSPSPFVFASPTPFIEEALQRQTQADINVANMQEEVLRKYPWYLKLPLQEKNYFVYFDTTSNSFPASIYPQNSSSIPIDDQVKSYQDQILEKLRLLGVDTNTYPVIWEIKPE